MNVVTDKQLFMLMAAVMATGMRDGVELLSDPPNSEDTAKHVIYATAELWHAALKYVNANEVPS